MKTELYLGDLVSNDWDGGIQIYEFPENSIYNRPYTPTSRFDSTKFGIIIEHDVKYLKSVKILTQDGQIGWVNRNFLTLINPLHI